MIARRKRKNSSGSCVRWRHMVRKYSWIGLVGLGLTQFLLLHFFLRSANRKLYEKPNHPVRQHDLNAFAEAQRGRFAQQQRDNLRTSIEARESTGNGHEKQPSEDVKQVPALKIAQKQATRQALDSAANSVGRHA